MTFKGVNGLLTSENLYNIFRRVFIYIIINISIPLRGGGGTADLGLILQEMKKPIG